MATQAGPWRPGVSVALNVFGRGATNGAGWQFARGELSGWLVVVFALAVRYAAINLIVDQ